MTSKYPDHKQLEIGGLWSCDSGQIRMTSKGQPSVFDIIRVLGGQKNPRDAWARYTEQHPEALAYITYHQFPGAGQRPTPVIANSKYDQEFVLMVERLEDQIDISASWAGFSTPITEKNIRRGLLRFLSECGEAPVEHLPCASGVADIVTAHTVIEVKKHHDWKGAVGQAMIYARDLNSFPEVALFGDRDYEHVLRTCTALGVACTTYPITGGFAQGLVDGVGTFKDSNYEQLVRTLRVRQAAAL